MTLPWWCLQSRWQEHAMYTARVKVTCGRTTMHKNRSFSSPSGLKEKLISLLHKEPSGEGRRSSQNPGRWRHFHLQWAAPTATSNRRVEEDHPGHFYRPVIWCVSLLSINHQSEISHLTYQVAKGAGKCCLAGRPLPNNDSTLRKWRRVVVDWPTFLPIQVGK